MKYFRSLDCGFLLTNWNDDCWSFTLLEGAQPWQGALESGEIAKIAAEVHQTKAEYTEAMKAIFSAQSEEFVVELDSPDSNDTKELSWKKLTTSGVKFSLGTIMLKKCEPGGIHDALSDVASLIMDLNQNFVSCRQRLEEAEAFSKGLTEKLDMFGNIKTQLESELYTKFALVLNEKKEKIRILKKEIAILKNETGTQSLKMSVNISKDKKGVKRDEMSSKMPECNEGDVDVSFVSKLPKQTTKKRASKVVPSSSLSKRSCQSYLGLASDDETADANELLEDL